jgi:hypothetical protein
MQQRRIRTPSAGALSAVVQDHLRDVLDEGDADLHVREQVQEVEDGHHVLAHQHRRDHNDPQRRHNHGDNDLGGGPLPEPVVVADLQERHRRQGEGVHGEGHVVRLDRHRRPGSVPLPVLLLDERRIKEGKVVRRVAPEPQDVQGAKVGRQALRALSFVVGHHLRVERHRPAKEVRVPDARRHPPVPTGGKARVFGQCGANGAARNHQEGKPGEDAAPPLLAREGR